MDNYWREFLKQNGYIGKVMGFNELRVKIGERNPHLSEEQQQRVEQRWSEVVRKNPRAYSNKILAVNDSLVDAQKRVVTIDAYVTGFKEYQMTKEDVGENDRVWGTGVAALAFVREGNHRVFIFAERTKNTLQLGGDLESIPSGFVEISSMDEHGEEYIGDNPFNASLIKKSKEELGVPNDKARIQRYLGMGQVRKFDRLYQDHHIDYLLEFMMTKKELEQSYAKNNSDKTINGDVVRHKRIILVNEPDLVAFIAQQREHIAIRTRFTLDSFFELGLSEAKKR